LLATYVIETKGTQEYRFTPAQFTDRFKQAYGDKAAAEISAHLAS
jgi:adenosine kinase